jgi:hypothetical protein
MLRIIFGLVVGIMLWMLGFLLAPSGYSVPIGARNVIEFLIPTIYLCVISLLTGFASAVIGGKRRIGIAILPVVLSFILLAFMTFSYSSKEILQTGILYFLILCAICLLFAAVGGLVAKLLKIRIPLKL